MKKDDSHFSYALSPFLDDKDQKSGKKRPKWLREVAIATAIIVFGLSIGLIVHAVVTNKPTKKAVVVTKSKPKTTDSKSTTITKPKSEGKNTKPSTSTTDTAPAASAITATAATPADDNDALNSIITSTYDQLVQSQTADPKLGCSVSPVAGYSYTIPTQTATSATAGVALRISGGGTATANATMTKSGTTWTLGAVTCQ